MTNEELEKRILTDLKVSDISELTGKITDELQGEMSITIAKKSDLYRIKTPMQRWQNIGGYDWDIQGDNFIEVYTAGRCIDENEISKNYKFNDLLDFVKKLDDLYECSQISDFR